MDEALGGAAFIGLNLLVVLAPALAALWLGLRAVRAWERSARAHEQLVQRVSELALLVGERSRGGSEPDRPSGI